jgi:hypothetical protein
MRFNRRRSDRSDSARSRLGSSLETLEGRTLLSQKGLAIFGQYAPSDLPVTNPITHLPTPYSVEHQLLSNPSPQNPLLGNEGKIVSGLDRAGDKWTITVHGPGTVIVTDTTPNDGSLDDNIDTIQLVGTNINTTYVTGNVVGSIFVQTNSTVDFNRLTDAKGVRSVILNGFSLSQTVAPAAGTPNNLNTGIFLNGGVRYLEFHDINAPIDTSTNDNAVNVIIGDPSTPLKVQPTIKLDSIINTVFDSTSSTVPTNGPITSPTVNIVVNGQIKGLDFISATSDTVPAADQFNFPTVATTGRTSVQAISINTLEVHGAATNFTASRASVPFQNGFSGLSKLKKAHFAGPTDAVGLDVNGAIGSLSFDKGISNTANLFLGTTADGAQIPATKYGVPADQTSYSGAGLIGGQVTATKIGQLKIGPSDVTTQSPSNPAFDQLFGTNTLTSVVQPGTAMANAVITTSGNIRHTKIVGNSISSEIKTGFHYPSYAAGLEGTRAASKIGKLKQTGSLLNSVTSATYRPFMNVYGTSADTRGPGKITGNLNGRLVSTGGTTALGNTGAGFFARTKNGYLPPPQASPRVNGVLK